LSEFLLKADEGKHKTQALSHHIEKILAFHCVALYTQYRKRKCLAGTPAADEKGSHPSRLAYVKSPHTQLLSQRHADHFTMVCFLSQEQRNRSLVSHIVCCVCKAFLAEGSRTYSSPTYTAFFVSKSLHRWGLLRRTPNGKACGNYILMEEIRYV